MTPMTRNGHDTSTLYMALELSAGKWKLAFGRESSGHRPGSGQWTPGL